MADEDRPLPRFDGVHTGVGREVHPTHAGAGAGAQPGRQQVLRGEVGELGVQELVDVFGQDPIDRLGRAQRDVLVLVHGHGEADRGGTGALPDPGLEDPELVLLDGELDVHHVPIVLLEEVEDLLQLTGQIREVLAELGQRQGVADAGDDVLTLGVHEEIAVQPRVPRWRGPG